MRKPAPTPWRQPFTKRLVSFTKEQNAWLMQRSRECGLPITEVLRVLVDDQRKPK
jgi:hypothetical protein